MKSIASSLGKFQGGGGEDTFASSPSLINIPVSSTFLSSSRIYIGSLADARNIKSLVVLEVTHVLTVANLDVYEKSIPNGICHFQVSLPDHPSANILEVLPPCFEFITLAMKSNFNLLIHCASGISRSVTVLAAFIMLALPPTSVSEAIKIISSCRRGANPNVGFRYQLTLLEDCANDVTAALEQLKVNSVVDVLQSMSVSRANANTFHAYVDEIEASFKASNPLTLSREQILIWIAQLESKSYAFGEFKSLNVACSSDKVLHCDIHN